MTYLSRDDILKPRDLKFEDVDIPELGGIVRIQELTAEGMNEFQMAMIRKGPSGQPLVGRDGEPIRDMTNRSAKIAVRAIVNPDTGEPLLSLADVDALGHLPATVVELIADVATRLSGMQRDDVEDAEENLDDLPEDSSSD